MMIGELGDSSRLFAALSDPARLRILELLDQRQVCVCKLAPKLKLSQPTVSYHIRLLSEAGLVTTRKEGTKVYCRAKRNVVRQVKLLVDMARRADQ